MILTLGLIALADVLLLTYWMRPPLVTVEAEITLGGESYSATEIQRLPTYDQLKDRWLVENQEVRKIEKYLVDPDPQHIGPDSVGLFLPLRLSEGGGLDTLRRAVQRLAESGICQIALLGSPNAGQSEATILRIQRYRNKVGLWKICKDAFNPPPFRLD